MDTGYAATQLQARYVEIATQLSGYEPRPIQAQMVQAIYQSLQTQQTIVIEAGTGSGKSFGYLIPALLSGKRPLVISTGTIALQEQLMEKDLPFVLKAAGLENHTVRLVKGRRNYLCIQKLQEFERTLAPNAPEMLYVRYLKSAFSQNWNGDKAKLDFEVPREIWDEVQSDSEDCLGKRCMYYEDNPYRLAREDLKDADVLVVNHALYLQDIISGQSLLPPHEVVIFDEAHHIKPYALRAFTARIGRFATQKLLRKIHRRLQSIPESMQHALIQLESRLLEWLFLSDKPTFKLFPDEVFLSCVEQYLQILSTLQAWLSAIDVSQVSLGLSELDIDRMTVQKEKLLEQLENLMTRWAFFLTPASVDRVHWAEVNHERLYYELKSTPLDIAEYLSSKLWTDKTGVLTSATLATNNTLGYFRTDLGLPAAAPTTPDLILDSPFDFQSQCTLYLPPDMPDPNDSLYLAAVTHEIEKLIMYSQGRAFILFTSYTAMDKVSSSLIPRMPYPAKTQGDLPKNRLTQWFKDTPHSVLFATASFWEGIDIPGEALSCVIMDRIPFSTPDEPVNSAMVNRMKQLGQDWFNGFVLPEATLRLKQGFGRLIRTRTDTGIVAILDPRLRTKGYGQKIIRSLPPAKPVYAIPDLIMS